MYLVKEVNHPFKCTYYKAANFSETRKNDMAFVFKMRELGVLYNVELPVLW